MKIQVNSGTGWATYEKEEGEAVARAFRDIGIPVEVRELRGRRAATIDAAMTPPAGPQAMEGES